MYGFCYCIEKDLLLLNIYLKILVCFVCIWLHIFFSINLLYKLGVVIDSVVQQSREKKESDETVCVCVCHCMQNTTNWETHHVFAQYTNYPPLSWQERESKKRTQAITSRRQSCRLIEFSGLALDVWLDLVDFLVAHIYLCDFIELFNWIEKK